MAIIPVAKKWFPGHYITAGSDKYDLTPAIKNIFASSDSKLFTGMSAYLTWSNLEITAGKFDFDKLSRLLDLLPAGKKFGCGLSWQAWPGGPKIPCPADMVGKTVYDGGYRVPADKPYPFSTIHMASTMDRYLAFVNKFAAKFDSDQRLAFVVTAEIPYGKSLQVGQFNRDVAIANYLRLAANFPDAFKTTVAGILGAWYPFGSRADVLDAFTQTCLEHHGGFGFPDLSVTSNQTFQPYLLANAGKWASWQGVEWADYYEKERTGNIFPNEQLAVANKTKTNFIWWLTANRVKEGGHSLDQAILYLRKNPKAGITTTCPSNIKPL